MLTFYFSLIEINSGKHHILTDRKSVSRPFIDVDFFLKTQIARQINNFYALSGKRSCRR